MLFLPACCLASGPDHSMSTHLLFMCRHWQVLLAESAFWTAVSNQGYYHASATLCLLSSKAETSMSSCVAKSLGSFREQMKMLKRILLSAGIGKSTLLSLISGHLEPTKGTITRNPKVRMAVFSQHHVDGLDLALTPLAYMLASFPNTKEQEHR